MNCFMVKSWGKKINSKSKNSIKKKAYEDLFTGYSDFGKWDRDYEVLCQESQGKECSIILYEFENINTINRFIGYEIGKKSVLKLLHMAEEFFCSGKITLITQSKIIIILMDKNREEAYQMAKEFLSSTKKPLLVENVPVLFNIKCSIEHDFLSINTKIGIINRLGKAMGQSYFSNEDISIYNEKMVKERQDYYNILVSICNGVDNDSFHLVYQPKIRMENNEIAGVEALLRWDNDTYRHIPISKVIKIAEDANIISQITKWVIKNAMIQLKEWKSIGREIRIAINLSAKDLQDYSMLEFIKENILLYDINPMFLEFELTERSIIDDEEKVFEILSEIKKMGIKVSMDDYGTGHNSMIYLGKSLFQFDYIKIDKMFIDEVTNQNTRTLIEGIIKTAHGWGMEIVAEGVENQEQLNILKELGCDIIQGYYYSKPLLPWELSNFTKQVDRRNQ